MGKYFGTDGFRGRAGKDLTAMHAFLTGRFLGAFYRKQNGDRPARIVIGKDTRKSSYMFENALASGITSSGSDAYLLHVTTTPCVSYITRTEHFDCGIMISASHNPFYDNGIKLLNADGEKMEDQTIALLEAYLDGESGEIPFETNERIGSTIDFYTGRNRYIGFLTTIPTRSFEHKKVGLDCANGASWMIARSVFDALGAKSYVIHAEPDGTNINKKCGSTHMEDLKKYVKDNGLDVGFAFDGDADRCLAVDEKGNEVNGDKILYVAAKWMKKHGILQKNTVVTTVMSNMGLYKAFDALDIHTEKTPVGDRFVYECMKANDYYLGGEQSGHVIFRKYASTGDGLVTALMIMSVMEETNLPLSVLTEGCETYPQILKNVEVDDLDRTVKDPAVLQAVKDVEAGYGDRGRVLLRKSGTEPVVRVMAEADTEDACAFGVDEIIRAIERSGHLLKVRQ